MNCQDVIALLADYLEMACPPETLASLEAHLAGCQPCQAYLRTYRRTREVVAASERATAPSGMPAEMKAYLRTYRRTREVVAASERAAVPPGMPAEMKAHLRAFLLAQLQKEEP